MTSARRPQRILGCPICGYRVDTKEHICPRCGSEFYEGTKFECPLCGGLVSSNERSCPSCHVDYADFMEKTIARGSDDNIDALLTEIIDLEAYQVKKEEKRFSCPKCGWMLDGSESTCPKCNHDLVTDLSFQCPVCGTIVASSAKSCSECGSSFEEPEERSVAPEQEAPKIERKIEAAEEFLRTAEQESTPSPDQGPVREVKPIVIVKAPPVISMPPEPVAEKTAPAPEPREPERHEPVAAEPEEPRLASTAESPVAASENDAVEKETTVDRAPEPALAPQDTSKKTTKKRKLKTKP